MPRMDGDVETTRALVRTCLQGGITLGTTLSMGLLALDCAVPLDDASTDRATAFGSSSCTSARTYLCGSR